MKYIVLPEIRADLLREAAYIRKRRSSSAKRLLADVRRLLKLVRGSPFLFGKTDDSIDGLETRECIVEHFGFRIVYTIESQTITILALIHGQLPPGQWHSRTDSLPKRN